MVRSAAQELIQEPATFAPVPSSKSYRLSRSDDLWFIDFEGERFGPYQTEREAMLFAIDAAHQFGDKGENTRAERAEGEMHGGAPPSEDHRIVRAQKKLT